MSDRPFDLKPSNRAIFTTTSTITNKMESMTYAMNLEPIPASTTSIDTPSGVGVTYRSSSDML